MEEIKKIGAEVATKGVAGDFKKLKKEAKIFLDDYYEYRRAVSNNKKRKKRKDNYYSFINNFMTANNLNEGQLEKLQELFSNRDILDDKTISPLVKIILRFQRAVYEYLEKKVELTFVATGSKGEPIIKVYSETEEGQILSKATGASGYFANLNPNRIMVNEKKIGKDIKEILRNNKDKEEKKLINSHTRKLIALYKFINKEKRLYSVDKGRLFLFWREEEGSPNWLHEYVNNMGVFNEGYVGAFVDYKNKAWSEDDKEKQIGILYNNYITQADNLAGMWGGDIKNDNIDFELAVKTSGSASSQSYKTLFKLAEWLQNQTQNPNDLMEAFYQHLGRSTDTYFLVGSADKRKGLKEIYEKELSDYIEDTLNKAPLNLTK